MAGTICGSQRELLAFLCLLVAAGQWALSLRHAVAPQVQELACNGSPYVRFATTS